MKDPNEKLSRFFSLHELRCPCCGACEMDKDYLTKLDDMREFYGQPLWILSGFRCPEHNKAVGGEEDSEHLLGCATDNGYTSGVQMRQLVRAAFAVDMTGIGINAGTIHTDFGSNKHNRMWHYYAKYREEIARLKEHPTLTR